MATETPRRTRSMPPSPYGNEPIRRPRGLVAAAKPALAAVGLWLISAFADELTDPTTATPMLVTSALAVGLLVWLVISGWALTNWAESRRWHVFRAAPTARSGLELAAIGGFLVVAAVLGSPFANLLTTFQIGSSDIADLALVIGAVTCLALACAALVASRDLQREEHRSLERLVHTRLSHR